MLFLANFMKNKWPTFKKCIDVQKWKHPNYISLPLCNLGDLFGEASLDWMVFFACLGLLEAATEVVEAGKEGGCAHGEGVTWVGWPSLILLSADGEGKLVSLLKLTELSLPIDLALLKPLELEVRLPRPLRTSRNGGGCKSCPLVQGRKKRMDPL